MYSATISMWQIFTTALQLIRCLWWGDQILFRPQDDLIQTYTQINEINLCFNFETQRIHLLFRCASQAASHSELPPLENYNLGF